MLMCDYLKYMPCSAKQASTCRLAGVTEGNMCIHTFNHYYIIETASRRLGAMKMVNIKPHQPLNM